MEPIISPNEPLPPHLSRKWIWWSLGIAVLIIAVAVGIWLVRTAKPSIPEGLAAHRADATRIIAEGNAIQDVDLRPLSAMELSKDYAGAIRLLDDALAVNAKQVEKNAELVQTSSALKDLTAGVRPAAVGDKAKEAFGLLDELARSQRTYLEARRALFEAAKIYYADLGAKKQVGVPEELNTLAATVTADLQKTLELAGKFQKAMQEFDSILAAK